jgi:hypothetical protein
MQRRADTGTVQAQCSAVQAQAQKPLRPSLAFDLSLATAAVPKGTESTAPHWNCRLGWLLTGISVGKNNFKTLSLLEISSTAGFI